MRIYICLLVAFIASGCSTTKPVEAGAKNSDHLRNLDYRDRFIEVPPQYFQETPQSKSVVAGSKHYAVLNYCKFIRRYQLKTNVDFNSALNLFKYRSYLMGASRIVIVDTDARSLTDASDVELIFHPGISRDNPTVSKISGDLYECPKPKHDNY